jgi:DNA-directed RNA polymerase subunit RPC12/RpoP
MAEYHCKKCGFKFNDLRALTTMACSLGGKHEPYEGGVKSEYACKKCGLKFRDFATLVRMPCVKGGKHEPML